jgi:hypothetical protein
MVWPGQLRPGRITSLETRRHVKILLGNIGLRLGTAAVPLWLYDDCPTPP